MYINILLDNVLATDVNKYSLASASRVSTNLTEQISRRFPGDSRRDFKKNPGHVCIALACYAMYRIANLLVCLNTEQKHEMHNMGAVAKIKRSATSFLNKRSGTQFHHDWKPMQSISRSCRHPG